MDQAFAPHLSLIRTNNLYFIPLGAYVAQATTAVPERNVNRREAQRQAARQAAAAAAVPSRLGRW